LALKNIKIISMTINEAQDFLKTLIINTESRSELRAYKKFLSILISLKKKELTDQQFQLIDQELDSLKIDADIENRKKHINKALAKLEKFLKKEFSFITEGYYMAIGMVLGMSVGIALGTSFGWSGQGIGIGMAVGLAVGAGIQAKAKKDGKVLETKLEE